MRVKTGLALATVALVVTAVIGTSASADPVAQASGLKQCLKKAKKIRNAQARKKAKAKCRAKFGTGSPVTGPGGPVPGQTPLVRATVTWGNSDNPNNTDIDLFVFDASGARAGNGANAIPNSILSPDVIGGTGTESFTDLAPNPLRPLSFGVCYKTGGSAHTKFTINYVTSDGVPHTDSQNPGSTFHYEYPGGPAIPSGYCPA